MIFLEDDDVAAVKDGSLAIHRIHRSVDDSTVREVITLKMEIQQIMKGETQGQREFPDQCEFADIPSFSHPSRGTCQFSSDRRNRGKEGVSFLYTVFYGL